MKTNIRLEIGEYTDADSQLRGALIEATNAGGAPIGALEVWFRYDFETPQVISNDSPLLTLQEIGRGFAFVPADGKHRGPLAVGQTRMFALPIDMMEQMRSVIQSLSPERYGIEIVADGEKGMAISGTDWGDFVQQKFPD